MNRRVIEIIDELVEVAVGIRRGSLWLHVDEESTKVAHTICDADPRAKKRMSCPERELTWGIGKMPSRSPLDLHRAPLPSVPAVGV
jgi:hypothetical protein